MAFENYESFVDRIELPIGDKTYTLPEVSAKLGIRINLVFDKANEALKIQQRNEEAAAEAKKAGKEPPEPEPLPDLKDADSIIKSEELLGTDLFNQMVEDGIPQRAIQMAAQVIYQDFLFGREAAQEYWNSDGDPKALAAKLPASNPFTTSGDAESTTQKPASTSGTKSKTKNSQSTTAGRKPSATRKSSKTGGSSKGRSKPASK
jgi:hypothetical protein